MKRYWLFQLLIIFILFNVGHFIWVGEQFWTIIDSDGSFRDQRTITDFISFKAENDVDDRYIAYWITPHCDGQNQFEAYGDAYFGDNGKLCAKFIDKNDHPIEICGGFRILSINSQDHENPFEWRSICDVRDEHIAVGINQHIVRIWQNDRFQFSIGGVLLDRGRAYTVGVNGAPLHIFRANDTNFYCSNIELLVVRDGYVAKEHVVHRHEGARQHRHRNHGHIFTPDDSLSPPCAGPCNLTRKDSSITYVEPPYIEPPPIIPPIVESPPLRIEPPTFVEPPLPPNHSPPSTITETFDCEEWKLEVQRFRADLEYKDGDLLDCRNKLKYHEIEIIKLKENQQTFISDEYLRKENENLRLQISRQSEFERENEQLKQRISQITILETTVTRLESENQRLKESLRIYESQKVEIQRVSECERKVFEIEKRMKFVNEDLSKERYRNDDCTSENERLRREIQEHSQKRKEIEKQWENAKHEFRNQKQHDFCNPGEIKILKEKIIFEQRRSEDRLTEIQRLTVKLVNVEDEKAEIEKQLLIIQSEQKSWNQTLIEVRRNCKSGKTGVDGFLEKRIQELEIVLTSKNELIRILKNEKSEIQKELVNLKSEYANLEIVLVDLKESKVILEDEKSALKSQIEILEENCRDSKLDGSQNDDDAEGDGSKRIKSKLKSFAQKTVKDGSSLITKERRCENLITKLRRIYNLIQISSELNVEINLYENDDDKFMENVDVFILQAWNSSRLEIEALKLKQKICISEINVLKKDIKILQLVENDDSVEDSDGSQISDSDSTKESETQNSRTIFERQLHSYELEVTQYRREIFMLKRELKNVIKVKYECQSRFQRFKASQNSLLTVFNRFETYLFNYSIGYNETRMEFFKLKEVIHRQTTLIKNYSILLRQKKDSAYSYEEEWSSSSNSGGGEYLEEEEYAWEKSSSSNSGLSDLGFRSQIKEFEEIEETGTSEDNCECDESVTEKYQFLIKKLRSVYDFLQTSIGRNITTQFYDNTDDEIFVELIDGVILQAWNISRIEVETYKLEQQTCEAEMEIVRKNFGILRQESENKIKELEMEKKNFTRQITFLDGKLYKFGDSEDSESAKKSDTSDGMKKLNFEYEHYITERNECEDKLNRLETAQTSFMSFYYRLENYLLKSECEKATTEITQFKQKLNNQTTTMEDIILHENDAIGVIMPQYHVSAMAQQNGDETYYETLNKIKEEISTLQKDLCDYRQNNSVLLQNIVERNVEMKKLRDSESFCKSTVISLNETNEQLSHILSEKEVEIENLKKQSEQFENRTLTAQIESLAMSKADEEITSKCEGLQSYLQDILVMLKRNKENCEEKFLDNIDENHIVQKREATTLVPKKKIRVRRHRANSPQQNFVKTH